MKPGCKQPEVEVIPKDWEVCQVRQKGHVLTGKALAASAPGTQRPYLRTKNVFDGRIDIEDVLTMPMTDEQFAQFEIRPGDVLLNEGQSLELVGRCAIYQGEFPEPCAIQNALLRFRARANVSGLFASYLFRHCQQTGVFARIALQTTSIAHLGGSRFERLTLAWPKTENEQRAIAEALSDVDGLIGALDALIAKKRDLKQAAMQQLLTAQTRLPGFSGEWVAKSFGDVVAPRKERVDPRNNGPFDFCIELEHIASTTGSLLGHTIAGDGASIKSVFSSGDVLFGKLRAYLRKYWRADCEGVCSTEIWVFRPKGGELLAEFLYHIVCTNNFIEAASNSYGTHMPRSDWNIVKELEVKLPPTKAEQTAIATVLSDMDAELAALEARREKTRALKQGMMQQLLTGQIRLV